MKAPDDPLAVPAARWPVAVILAAILASQAAKAEPNHPALRQLLPLAEIYAKGQATPPYDVAGLRCGGLLLAQFDWSARNPEVTGPDQAAMAKVDSLFEASERQRLNDGMELGRAHVSIEREAKRVWRLYERRFAANAKGGGHPWLNDPLISGDAQVCAALLRGL